MAKLKETTSVKQAWVTLAIVIAVSGLFGLVVLPRLGPATSPLSGERAPDFVLPVHHGGEPGSRVRLSDLSGKAVILDFWASWCGPCLQQIPILAEYARSAAGQSIRILGVNTGDTPDAADSAMAALEPPYPSVTDAGGRVAAAFAVDGLPTLVLVGPEGRVRGVSQGLSDAEQLRDWVEAALQ